MSKFTSTPASPLLYVPGRRASQFVHRIKHLLNVLTQGLSVLHLECPSEWQEIFLQLLYLKTECNGCHQSGASDSAIATLLKEISQCEMRRCFHMQGKRLAAYQSDRVGRGMRDTACTFRRILKFKVEE